jgi:hypothetical protein
MARTTSVITIDQDTYECTLYSNLELLSKYLCIPRETIVNWFRDGNRLKIYRNLHIYKVDRRITQKYDVKHVVKHKFG